MFGKYDLTKNTKLGDEFPIMESDSEEEIKDIILQVKCLQTPQMGL